MGNQGKKGNEMKMITVYLSDGDEKRLQRSREVRYPNTDISNEHLIKNAISVYWLFSEKGMGLSQEEKADKRLREENMGLTDSWRDYDG
jgi:hypothetical protein